MKINPTLTALPTRSEGPVRDFLQTLSPGQVLQGKVVDLPESGTARLQIGLIELLARTKTQLSPGQTLELEVKQLKPLPELKILNPPPDRPPRDLVLQQSLPKQIPVREMVRELQRLLSPASDSSGSPARAPTRTAATAAAVPPQARPDTLPRAPAGQVTLPASHRSGDGPSVRLDPSPPTAATLAGSSTAAPRPIAAATVHAPTAPPAAGGVTTGQSAATPAATGTSPGLPPAATEAATGKATPASRPLLSPGSDRPAAAPGAALAPPPSAKPSTPTAPGPGAAKPINAIASNPGESPARPTATVRPPASQPPSTASLPEPPRYTGQPVTEHRAPPTPFEQLPKPVQLAVVRLLRPAPQAPQISAIQVKQQLSESGLFLEQQFARGAIPTHDNKLDMLRLLQLLTTSRNQSGSEAIPPRSRPEVTPGSPAPPGTRPSPAPLHLPELQPPAPLTQVGAPPPVNLTGSLTEQLLRLLTGAGRRAGTNSRSAPGPTTGAPAPATQTASAANPVDPRLKAEYLLQTMQPEKGPRPGSREAARGSEAANNPPVAAQRALTDRLLQLVEGGLARIQTHQAATLTQAEDGRQIWQFELPLNRGQERDEVLVRLEQEQVRRSGAEQSRWTATLRFAFDNLGSVEARLMLEGERLSSTFWCERADTERRFAGRFSELENGLHKVGLEIGRLTAVQGTPPNPLDLPKPPAGMLDTHV